MSNFEVIDQETIGRAVNGVDYGAPGKVLARTPETLLVWFGGSSGRGGGYYSVWNPATMRLLPRNEHGWRHLNQKICEGERFHQRVFERYAAKIDQYMGEGFHKLLDIKKTIVVGENKTFSKFGHEISPNTNSFGYAYVMSRAAARAKHEAAGLTGLALEMAVVQEPY